MGLSHQYIIQYDRRKLTFYIKFCYNALVYFRQKTLARHVGIHCAFWHHLQKQKMYIRRNARSIEIARAIRMVYMNAYDLILCWYLLIKTIFNNSCSRDSVYACEGEMYAELWKVNVVRQWTTEQPFCKITVIQFGQWKRRKRNVL